MILLGLGSNIGDRAHYLSQAQRLLAANHVAVVRSSGTIETSALLPEGAPADWNIPYLNQVVAVETEQSPMALLASVNQIEQALGRIDRGRWGPREIDIDILSYHDEVMDNGSLTLPHPHMHTRAFVLKPLAEIAPDWRHPLLGKTAAQLLIEDAA